MDSAIPGDSGKRPSMATSIDLVTADAMHGSHLVKREIFSENHPENKATGKDTKKHDLLGCPWYLVTALQPRYKQAISPLSRL